MTRTRKILTFILILCVIVILLIKYVWANISEKWSYGAETGDILFNLCIGYISAFIFYYIDVWIPQNQEQKITNNRLSVPLSRLLNEMKHPIVHVYKDFGDPIDNFDLLDEKVFLSTIGKVDLINDSAPLLWSNLNRNATYGEFFHHEVSRAIEYIDELYKLPIKLDIELVEILDDIKKSNYHDVINGMQGVGGFYGRNINLKGHVIAKSLYKYYKLFLKLKRYMLENKIAMSIENL